MKPKSDNLFHFTKSLDILKLILLEGIKPRYCLEDFEWFFSDADDYAAYPMSCFCDIPLSRLSEHTNFYGSYGIGLTKKWGITNKLNPVVYCPPGGHIQSLAKDLVDWKSEDKQKNEDASMHFFRLLSLIKPIVGRMVIAGKVIEKEFYQENEWRFVPEVNKVLLGRREFEDKRDDANKNIEKYTLQFTPRDIRYILVPNDSEIPALVDFINGNLGQFPLNDLKILQSRIISLETLNTDL